MDPLHPIIPVSPNIPPVLPSSATGKIDRDTPREKQEGRRKREQPDDSDNEAGTGQHVDITA
jgi:hypothetical protein